MRSGRRSFAHLPTTHFLLCGLVPNRSQTGTGLHPGVWGPLIYGIFQIALKYLKDMFSLLIKREILNYLHIHDMLNYMENIK